MKNLVIEFDGKFIVNATANQVYEKSYPISLGNHQPVVQISGWFETYPPMPMEVVQSKSTESYWNAILLIE
jgi:hypothetical protein